MVGRKAIKAEAADVVKDRKPAGASSQLHCIRYRSLQFGGCPASALHFQLYRPIRQFVWGTTIKIKRVFLLRCLHRCLVGVPAVQAAGPCPGRVLPIPVLCTYASGVTSTDIPSHRLGLGVLGWLVLAAARLSRAAGIVAEGGSRLSCGVSAQYYRLGLLVSKTHRGRLQARP